jgi:hypothetical protein
MSDDFDDDLYNVYNAGKEDTYNDEDLYGEDPVDVKEEFVDANSGNLSDFHQQDHQQQQQEQDNEQQQQQLSDMQQRQQQQRQQQMKYMQQQGGSNWGYQPNAYQQYMVAYQRSLQQQMAANPYQMQQMIQRQMSQHFPQQQYTKPRQTRTDDSGGDKPIVASAANTDEG